MTGPLEVTMHDRGFPAGSRTSELAAGLLDVVSESELEDFLGGLVVETARNAGRRIGADNGRALVASLRRTAEQTLPTLSVALGDAGRSVAPGAARTAARIFGVELEGMSAEDRDFEIARRFVRFAQAATVQAARP
jgi:hypothetical protein